MVNLWKSRLLEENSKASAKKTNMELEMFLDGKFIDAVTINESDLKRLDKLQQKMERKHCHQLEYSDGQPQFFISGVWEENVRLRRSDPGSG